MERTLDDSANKRIAVAEAFLATDAILNIYMNVTENMTVYEAVVHRRVTVSYTHLDVYKRQTLRRRRRHCI